MGSQLRMAYEQAMRAARRHYERREWYAAFAQLERAHILGQRDTVAHVRSHWWMLRVGWRRGDWREWAGQLTRIVAAMLFSRIWVPAGNTGGADVSPIRPMPVPADLQMLLDADRQERRRAGWRALG
jgi:hypothetical protein